MPKTAEERDGIKRQLDLQLDQELADSFPASDAPKITRRGTAKPPVHKPKGIAVPGVKKQPR